MRTDRQIGKVKDHLGEGGENSIKICIKYKITMLYHEGKREGGRRRNGLDSLLVLFSLTSGKQIII